jgi:hypothetical protein
MLPAPPEFLDAVRQGEDPVDAGSTEYLWPSLGERRTNWEASPRELEPGEVEEIHYDFAIDSEAETIEVYSYFKNSEKRGREIGWSLTTLCDLVKKEAPMLVGEE